MDRLLKVATPLAAATVVVPLSVPPAGLVPEGKGAVEVELTRLLPAWSSSTVTAGVMAWVAAVLLGCCRKARWVAAPTRMLKAAEVAPVRPLLLAARV